MKKPFLFTIMFIAAIVANAQVSKTDTSQVFTSVDNVPEFPGGNEKCREYIGNNLKNTKRKIDKTGYVFIGLIVEKDGSFTNLKVVKSLNTESDSIAFNIVSKSPKWIPAMKNSRPVRCKYSVPVWFGDPRLELRVSAPRN